MTPSVASLHDLGWHRRNDAGHTFHPSFRPARVTHQGAGAWHVHDGSAELVAHARSRSLDPVPVTGDWVLIDDGDGSCYIVDVLPRTSTLSRNEAGPRSAEQVIAANVDVVAICSPASDVNVRRIERELTAAWSTGALPLVVVTKADLADDLASVMSAVEVACIGADVVAVSSRTGEGVAGVAAHLEPGATMVLIGPSGVGKSSLVNALAGDPVLATTDVRADGKGRHTTTSRHLVVLAGGGLLLDTPGMREFAPWADDDALATAFADIDALADGCRFADCAHDAEPGCAVQAAAADDAVVAERLASWRRLQREMAWLARRNDARLMREESRRWAAMTKSARGAIRP